MNRWDHRWYEPKPKLPPPKHGIKVRKAGATWWGRRWIDALTAMSSGYSNRLGRGRTYARAGRTHDLVVNAGHVTAKVTGSRPTPYKVTITLAKLSDVTWRKAIHAMAEKAQFTAELLVGQMPEEIDDAFRSAGTSLFPAKEADLSTACSCPDWANPCKHVAATHYVLGEALDRDPFLLFELRGRTKDQVLAELRAARGGDVEAGLPRGRRGGTEADVEIPKVALGRLTDAEYDKPREALPLLHLAFDAPVVSRSVLRQLGTPAAWSKEAAPADLLAPLVRAAAERARQLALAEPEAAVTEDTTERATKPPKTKRTTSRSTASTRAAKARATTGARASPRAATRRGR